MKKARQSVAQEVFTAALSEWVWQNKYQLRNGGAIQDRTIRDTWRRVATCLAACEESRPDYWETNFYNALADFKFIPGGRILAGAGTARTVTLFNCFVMGTVEDSMDQIFDALKQGALTMQQGGGVGYDFSTLRPAGTLAKQSGTIASGPVSFMRIWDSMCATLLSTGARRGAMMATLRCDHPDIEEFIDAKRNPHELRHFNLSVQVTDEFMQAIRDDADWALVFPSGSHSAAETSRAVIERVWTGASTPIPCEIVRVVRARELWDRLMRATYDCAEPGVLFIDRINQTNPLWYREVITTTNPCGEVPLPPYGACDLGSINLTQFVTDPFSADAALDAESLAATTRVAVRMLDNVIDVSHYPLEEQRQAALATRRVGLGITGLGDALCMLGLHYDSEDARRFAASTMRDICHTAYRTSTALAGEKGCFPLFQADEHLRGSFIQTLPDSIRADIAATGLRNSHLLAVAPTGTVSLLANNVSSGIEPVFALKYQRRVLGNDGTYTTHKVTDYAWRCWTRQFSGPPPAVFVTARDLSPQAHLTMQAALQPFVDQAISKTINVAPQLDFEEFRSIYQAAYELGLKGCTTYRENPVTGTVLSEQDSQPGVHCCSIERECD